MFARGPSSAAGSGAVALPGVEVEPALTALGPGPRVPRQAEGLEPPPGERDEVLLEGIDAEGVGDLELAELAVRAVGADEELPVAAEERRGDAPVGDPRLVEAAEDRLVRGGLHRAGMVRGPVGLGLLGVAAGTLRAADEARRRGGGLRGRGRLLGALAADREGHAGQGQPEDCEADAPRARRRAPVPPAGSRARARATRPSAPERSAGGRRHPSPRRPALTLCTGGRVPRPRRREHERQCT